MEPWSCHGRLESLGRSPPALRWYPSRKRDGVTEPLAYRPAMVRQPGGHRRGPLLPLPPWTGAGGDPEAVVDPAEVVGAPHQVHPGGQRLCTPGERPTATRQGTQHAAKRRVEPLDVRRVDPRPGAGRRQHRGDGLGRPPDHPAGDADEASSGVVLDYLAQEQPGCRDQPWPARTAGAYRVAEDPGEGGN